MASYHQLRYEVSGLFRDLSNRRCPVTALAISFVAGAALCSLMSMPVSAMPMSKLAAAASDLALGQSARYYRRMATVIGRITAMAIDQAITAMAIDRKLPA